MNNDVELVKFKSALNALARQVSELKKAQDESLAILRQLLENQTRK